MHRCGSEGQEGRSKKLTILAYAIKAFPTQTRADLQRFFNLNLDRMGTEFTAFHAASCLACLPRGSALLSELFPEMRWSDQEFMLHGVLAALVGKEIPYPWTSKSNGNGIGVETKAVPIDQFKDWYEKSNWKEVEDWQVTR